MARVVQRRSNPSYVLILVVFLMLVATAMAVKFYTDLGKARRDLDDRTAMQAKVYSDADISDPIIRKMIEEPAKGGPLSVLGQLKTQITSLAKAIVPANPSYSNAEAIVNECSRKYGNDGLASLLEQFGAQIDTLKQQLGQMTAERDAMAAEKTQAITQVQQMTEAQKAEFASFENKIQDLTKKSSESNDEYQQRLTTIRADITKQMEDYGKTLNDKTAQASKLQDELAKANRTIDDQKERIRVLEGKSGPATIAIKPDGKIAKLVSGDKVCYINIGSDDHVTPGVTFAVYSPIGFGVDSKRKATIKVNRVENITSECTILDEDDRNPIAQNDLVSNLSFDARRNQVFVVEGMFDLRGNGKSDSASAEAVKDMIVKSGSKVTDVVDSQVDFVVLGDQPARPPKPAEGSDAQAEKLYRDKEKEYLRYNEVANKAKDMKIPVLNGNRFLSMMGYGEPKK
jgi:hypothetical protein